MNATDVEPNRLSAAVKSAKRLTDELPETFRLGLVTFSDFAEQRAAPSTDRAAVSAALDRLTAVGGTAMGLGLERGLEAAMTPVANEDGTGTRLSSKQVKEEVTVAFAGGALLLLLLGSGLSMAWFGRPV
jgi:Ca-activated chloride channel family protein